MSAPAGPECGIAVGWTCRIGGGKTVWEVLEVFPEQPWNDGPTAYITSTARDGFVNYTKPISELTDLQPPTSTWTLGVVLKARADLAGYAKKLADRTARGADLEELDKLRLELARAFVRYDNAWTSYYDRTAKP